MRIRMLVDVQGFRALANGEKVDWPARGVESDVEDDVALELVRSGQAVPVATFGNAENTMAPDAPESRVAGTSARLMARPVDHDPRAEVAKAERLAADAAVAPVDEVEPVADAPKAVVRSRKSVEADKDA